MKKIDNQAIRLSEYVETGPMIENISFENCHVIGPAVVVLLNNVSLTNSQLEGNPDALFWEIPESRKKVIGAIGLQNVRFNKCKFTDIGFAGPHEAIKKFMSDIGDSKSKS